MESQSTPREVAAAKNMAERSILFWLAAYREVGVILPGLILIQNPVEGRAVVIGSEVMAANCPAAIRNLVQSLAPKVKAKWVIVSAPVLALDSATGYNGKQIPIDESICLLTVLDGPGISHSWLIPLNDNGTTGQVTERDHKFGEGVFAGISGYGPAVSISLNEVIAP